MFNPPKILSVYFHCNNVFSFRHWTGNFEVKHQLISLNTILRQELVMNPEKRKIIDTFTTIEARCLMWARDFCRKHKKMNIMLITMIMAKLVALTMVMVVGNEMLVVMVRKVEMMTPVIYNKLRQMIILRGKYHTYFSNNGM